MSDDSDDFEEVMLARRVLLGNRSIVLLGCYGPCICMDVEDPSMRNLSRVSRLEGMSTILSGA